MKAFTPAEKALDFLAFFPVTRFPFLVKEQRGPQGSEDQGVGSDYVGGFRPALPSRALGFPQVS